MNLSTMYCVNQEYHCGPSRPWGSGKLLSFMPVSVTES